MTRRSLVLLPQSFFAVLSPLGQDRCSLAGWSPLTKRRTQTSTFLTRRYGQQKNGSHHRDSSKLKCHHSDDNHDDTKRYSSSSTTAKGYNNLPRLYVGDRQSSSNLWNNGPLLFHAKDWQTMPLYELLLRASRADAQQQVQQQLTLGATLLLNADQSHYLTTVLRLGKKTKHIDIARNNPAPLVRIFDETAGEWLAEVDMTDEPFLSNDDKQKKKKKHQQQQQVVSVTCLQQLRPPAGSQQKQQQNNRNSICWMAVALPKKKDRCRWLIEKCTELGVAGFIFLDTDYSESSASEVANTGSKLVAYAMEAAEQSERLDLPAFVALLKKNHNKESHGNTSSPGQKQHGNNNAKGIDGVGTATTLTTLLDAWCWDRNTNAEEKNGDDSSSSSQQPIVPDNKPFLLACRERIDHSVSVIKVIREQILNQQPISSSSSSWSSKDPMVGASDALQPKPPEITLFLVGPEGGWSPAEQARFNELAQHQQSNAISATNDDGDTTSERKRSFMWNVSLGPSILRAETAAVTAAAAHALVLDELDSR
jgi:16S rRNA U1498 N3-methylase RsmE